METTEGFDVRILLADDHVLVRAGLRALIAALPEVTEVIEASDGREALSAVATHHPDLVLMDIAMPAMNGLEAMSRILRDSPGTRVIILSMHEDDAYVWRALRSGATGYLVKAAAVEELGPALRAAGRGETYVSPAIRRHVSDGDRSRGRNDLDPSERLTPRQREILQLIAEGLTSRRIAQTLQIHIKTVESHRTELMKRLGVHEVAGLVRYAIRHGLAQAG